MNAVGALRRWLKAHVHSPEEVLSLVESALVEEFQRGCDSVCIGGWQHDSGCGRAFGHLECRLCKKVKGL